MPKIHCFWLYQKNTHEDIFLEWSLSGQNFISKIPGSLHYHQGTFFPHKSLEQEQLFHFYSVAKTNGERSNTFDVSTKNWTGHRKTVKQHNRNSKQNAPQNTIIIASFSHWSDKVRGAHEKQRWTITSHMMWHNWSVWVNLAVRVNLQHSYFTMNDHLLPPHTHPDWVCETRETWSFWDFKELQECVGSTCGQCLPNLEQHIATPVEGAKQQQQHWEENTWHPVDPGHPTSGSILPVAHGHQHRLQEGQTHEQQTAWKTNDAGVLNLGTECFPDYFGPWMRVAKKW